MNETQREQRKKRKNYGKMEIYESRANEAISGGKLKLRDSEKKTQEERTH